MRSGLDDLADPVAWLRRRNEMPITGATPRCPLDCLRSKDAAELDRRVWRAQLSTIFPEIESQRLAIVAKHRSSLRVDDHLRERGVSSVEEVELGALYFQLRRVVTRAEAERLELLARARNSLAHRVPVSARDTSLLLRALTCSVG